ncbi:MAG: hypothetical protein ACI9T7_002057 [Oleiphilaceae bacterium]|jgi:hypothetical protein
MLVHLHIIIGAFAVISEITTFHDQQAAHLTWKCRIVARGGPQLFSLTIIRFIEDGGKGKSVQYIIKKPIHRIGFTR